MKRDSATAKFGALLRLYPIFIPLLEVYAFPKKPVHRKYTMGLQPVECEEYLLIKKQYSSYNISAVTRNVISAVMSTS